MGRVNRIQRSKFGYGFLGKIQNGSALGRASSSTGTHAGRVFYGKRCREILDRRRFSFCSPRGARQKGVMRNRRRNVTLIQRSKSWYQTDETGNSFRRSIPYRSTTRHITHGCSLRTCIMGLCRTVDQKWAAGARIDPPSPNTYSIAPDQQTHW